MIRTTTVQSGVIGVDIGAATVKVAQVERRAQGLVLARAAVVPRQGDRAEDSCPQSVEYELRRALAVCDGLRGTKVRSVLSPEACHYASELVAGELSMEGAAQRAADIVRRSSYPVDDRQYDFWTTGARSSTVVHVLVAGRRQAEQAAIDHRRAGLACEAIEGLPQVLARTSLLSGHDQTVPAAILDWGYTSTTFCVASGGVPLFVRRLPGAEYRLVEQAICRHLAVSPREACWLMMDNGVRSASAEAPGTPIDRRILEVLEEPLERLTDQLRRTWAFLQTYHADLVPGHLLLTGGGATVAGLAPLLARHVPIPVDIWHFPSSVSGVATCLVAAAISLSAERWAGS